MEKLYLIVALSAIFALNGEAKDRYHKEMNKGIVVRDTLTLNSLEIINLNGHDSIVSMTEEKIPIYRVLTEKRGNAMTPRDWAEYKTENMRHRLHLNNKQTEKLFKLNLMESKERTNYKKEKFAMLQTNDTFGRLLAVGLVCTIFWPAMLNMMVVTSLLPNSGLPLPFISYGGTNLVFTIFAIGLLTSIQRFTPTKKEVYWPIRRLQQNKL